jgi:hypothetical protein
MLDGVASGKRLPEKNIIVLGMLFGTLVSGINSFKERRNNRFAEGVSGGVVSR